MKEKKTIKKSGKARVNATGHNLLNEGKNQRAVKFLIKRVEWREGEKIEKLEMPLKG